MDLTPQSNTAFCISGRAVHDDFNIYKSIAGGLISWATANSLASYRSAILSQRCRFMPCILVTILGTPSQPLIRAWQNFFWSAYFFYVYIWALSTPCLSQLEIRSMPLSGLTTTILPALTAFVFHCALECLWSWRVNVLWILLLLLYETLQQRSSVQ